MDENLIPSHFHLFENKGRGLLHLLGFLRETGSFLKTLSINCNFLQAVCVCPADKPIGDPLVECSKDKGRSPKIFQKVAKIL